MELSNHEYSKDILLLERRTGIKVELVTDMMQEALFLVLKTSAPLLLVSLVIGLCVSIFQTVTSIQEQTLTFVPKMVGMFIGLMLIGHWMLNQMTTYMEELWGNFLLYIR